MQQLTHTEFQTLVKHAKILEQDKHGGKVFLTPDDHIIKCFRVKSSSLSSNRLWPYAQRFIKNADKLRHRDIQTIEVTKSYYIPENSRYAVVYPLIPGNTIRELLPNNDMLSGAIEYIAELHNRGIYFRSLHFGNILIQPNNEHALIDIADTSFHWFNLNIFNRLRNIRHLLRYAQDNNAIVQYGKEAFLNKYLDASKLCKPSKIFFRHVYYRLF